MWSRSLVSVLVPCVGFACTFFVCHGEREHGHPPVASTTLRVAAGHPRCVFGGEKTASSRSFEQVRGLYQNDPQFRAIMEKALEVDPADQHPAANAACWIVSREDRFAEAAIERMLNRELDKSGEPYYSRVWSYALAYDWLFHHPLLTDSKKDLIVAKIKERIETELADLDGDYMALWHGRNQAANGVMIAAVALADEAGMEPLLARALGHWLESLRALRYSGGWPEGASYWIYNRAGPYALAADAVMTATGLDSIEDVKIREVMRIIGLWQLYQYGPNGVFEPYGDSAGSLHLGDTGWWTLTTDHYAKLSRSQSLAAAGDYFRNRSPDPYGRRKYYWNVAVTYDPTVRHQGMEYDPAAPEIWMRKRLPQALLFGRDSYGVAYFRGDWGDPNELFASFKAGDLLAHHDHYDVGNFTIQRGGELVPQTGFYGSYYEEHRLGYQVQTVSANSLLILAPGERSNYLQRRKEWWPWVSGGQRVISPTGFNCVSRRHYEEQLLEGPGLERATITAWESVPGQYDYAAADITSSYNSSRFAEPGSSAKVELVTRQFLFLRDVDAFVVFDRVETTRPEYLPKFLLHSNAKPLSRSEEIVKGVPDNGILVTSDREFTHRYKDGHLTARVLLPTQARTYKIGGPDYCFYVEFDSDQSDGFDGKNLIQGSGRRGSVRTLDQWRIEVEPKNPTDSTRFLTVLMPRLVSGDPVLPEVELLDSGIKGQVVMVDKTVLVFSDDGHDLDQLRLPVRGAERCLLLDAVPGGVYRLNGGATVRASREGVLRLDLHHDQRLEVELASRAAN